MSCSTLDGFASSLFPFFFGDNVGAFFSLSFLLPNTSRNPQTRDPCLFLTLISETGSLRTFVTVENDIEAFFLLLFIGKQVSPFFLCPSF